MSENALTVWLGHLARRTEGRLAPQHRDAAPGVRVVGAGLRLSVRPDSEAAFDQRWLEARAPALGCAEAFCSSLDHDDDDAATAPTPRCRHYAGAAPCPPPHSRDERPQPPPPIDPVPSEPRSDAPPGFGGCRTERTAEGETSSRRWRIRNLW